MVFGSPFYNEETEALKGNFAQVHTTKEWWIQSSNPGNLTSRGQALN